MTWVTFDDGAPLHRKQLAAGPKACWLWACGLAYCYGQESKDGFIPEAVVQILYPRLGLKEAKTLVDVRLWERADGGYLIHDYLEWKERRFNGPKNSRGKAGGSVSSEAKRQAALAREAGKRIARQSTTSTTTTEHNGAQRGTATLVPTTTSPTDRTLSHPEEDVSDPELSDSSGSSKPKDLTGSAREDRFFGSLTGPDDELPVGWEPTETNRATALRLRLDVEEERAMHAADRRRKGFVCGNWEADFELWLQRSAKMARQQGARRAGGADPDWPTDDALRFREAVRAGREGKSLQAKERAGNLDYTTALRLSRERNAEIAERAAERRPPSSRPPPGLAADVPGGSLATLAAGIGRTIT